MFGGDRDLDTICAISTPSGVGGIHVVRISGDKALKIVRQSAPFLPASIESHRVYFGTLVWDLIQQDFIDEVLVTFFRQGHSFTGEETVEISCHGSPFIANRILKVLLRDGARMADRGEFTYRSFINGKLDLVQAESVLSLIESESHKSSQIALNQLKGGLSHDLRDVESNILALLARLEISIDFTAEDVEIISKEDICHRLRLINQPIFKLLETFKLGSKIQSGFEVVLIGEPNVGKSSLLNRILAEDRAIVTEIPGTTRDLIQEQIMIKGVKVSLIDSAGIRDTSDVVEKIGVNRTRGAIEKADLVLAVFDSQNPRLDELQEELPLVMSKVVFVGNKIDLIDDSQKAKILADLQVLLMRLNKFQNPLELEPFIRERCIFVSSLVSESRDQMIRTIESHLDTGSFGDEAVLSQARHFENLQRASECFSRAAELANEGSSPEFLALEVKEGLIRIQETLGERFDDQVLDRVFSEFCIGK
jgi:tRNA modification GTPase